MAKIVTLGEIDNRAISALTTPGRRRHPRAGRPFSLEDKFGPLDHADRFYRVRGGRLISHASAVRLASRWHQGGISDIHPGIAAGGVMTPASMATLGFATVGDPGSGKTTALVEQLQTTVPLVGLGWGARLLVFDPKGSLLGPIVSLANPDTAVVCLNPSVKGSAGINVADMVQNDTDAEQFMSMLVDSAASSSAHGHSAQSKEEHFWRTVVLVTGGGVVKILIRIAPGLWDLRDLIGILSKPACWRPLFRRFPEHRHIVSMVLDNEDKRTTGNLRASIEASIGPYRTLAACLHSCPENYRISPRQFLKEEVILHLGLRHSADATVLPLYRFFLHSLSNAILDTVNAVGSVKQLLFMILEEAALLRGVNLVPLATNGREAGVSMNVLAQSLPLLFDAFGRERTLALLSTLQHFMAFKCDDEMTAEYVSLRFGSAEGHRYSRGSNKGTNWSRGPNGMTVGGSQGTSLNEGYVEKRLVMPTEVRNLAMTNREFNPFAEGFAKLPEAFNATHPFRLHVPTVYANLPRQIRVLTEERSAEEQRLTELDEGDLKRLGLDGDADFVRAVLS
ncbi:MAG: type IV secretion system DNA-binding domain-containing protein [Gemmataceae bacterium]